MYVRQTSADKSISFHLNFLQPYPVVKEQIRFRMEKQSQQELIHDILLVFSTKVFAAKWECISDQMEEEFAFHQARVMFTDLCQKNWTFKVPVLQSDGIQALY